MKRPKSGSHKMPKMPPMGHGMVGGIVPISSSKRPPKPSRKKR